MAALGSIRFGDPAVGGVVPVVADYSPNSTCANRSRSSAPRRCASLLGDDRFAATTDGRSTVTVLPDISAARDCLTQRLSTIAPHILGRALTADSSMPAAVLVALVDHVAQTRNSHEAWLLATAIAGGYPSSEEVEAMLRGLQTAEPAERMGIALGSVAVTASAVRSDSITLEVVTDAVVVDVHFCATNAHNTGIQRVVRNTVPHWNGVSALLAWTADGTGYRRLTNSQHALVTDWHSGMAPSPAGGESDVLVVPLGGTVLVPEVPAHEHLERLIAIARYSGNRVGLIGYDAIPIVSADFVSEEESDRFAHYVGLVKHSTVVSCINRTTAEEFERLVAALAAQGLRGPHVEPLPLPVVAAHEDTTATVTDGLPLVLMVGSIEPRKNQLGLVSAASMLWKAGREFELLLVGGGSAANIAELERAVLPHRRVGRAISIARGWSDEQLGRAYARARVVVFPSLQEGYGLPVAEALATGTPVVTSNFGSTAEIATAGGCITVDPRDDAALAAAIDSVLSDDELHARLVAEARARRGESWNDYAAALWTQLTEDAA
jgi:glycosyltransferase involved in cell wall biosynthesis